MWNSYFKLWTAYNEAYKTLANFTKLNYLSDEENTVLTLTTTASSNVVDVVLQQHFSGENKLSFFF